MKKFACITTMSALVTALYSGPVQAATFTEMGDAGETLETAQASQGSGPLDSIFGALSTVTPDADLFRIFLTGGQAFSASTVGGAEFDTQLFLFNKKGMGIYGNDNASHVLGENQSTLSSDFSPTKSGFYYLAVSGFDYDPVDSEGEEIFPDPAFPFNQVFGPTGPGGESHLSGFNGTRLNGGSYAIALTGAKAVPEPSSTLGILAFGALSTVFWLKHQKGKQV